jgi:hypothetical protein
MNYHLMLQERVRGLIAAGSEVVVVGELNTCVTTDGHCGDGTSRNASTFYVVLGCTQNEHGYGQQGGH